MASKIWITCETFDSYLSGWWYTYPLKNISQLGCIFPIYGKIKNVPNDVSNVRAQRHFNGIASVTNILGSIGGHWDGHGCMLELSLKQGFLQGPMIIPIVFWHVSCVSFDHPFSQHLAVIHPYVWLPCSWFWPNFRKVLLILSWFFEAFMSGPEMVLYTYSLVICYIAIENGHRNSWFTKLKDGDVQ